MEKGKMKPRKVAVIFISSLFLAVGILAIIFGALVTDGYFSQRDENYIYSISGEFASNYSNYEKATVEVYWTIYYLLEVTIGISLLVIGCIMIGLSIIKLLGIIDEEKISQKEKNPKVVVVDESGDDEKIIQKVEKMYALFEKGVLNDEEYSKIKNNLLNRM